MRLGTNVSREQQVATDVKRSMRYYTAVHTPVNKITIKTHLKFLLMCAKAAVVCTSYGNCKMVAVITMKTTTLVSSHRIRVVYRNRATR
jgi:hypothetical protein